MRKSSANGQLFAANRLNDGSGDPYVVFYVYHSAMPVDMTEFPAGITGTGWNHYVLQRRGDTFEVWANGALVQSDTTVGNDGDFSGPAGLYLGGTGSNRAQGTMDDFRVYDRAMSAQEIGALAAAP